MGHRSVLSLLPGSVHVSGPGNNAQGTAQDNGKWSRELQHICDEKCQDANADCGVWEGRGLSKLERELEDGSDNQPDSCGV